eukprot:TRINITY_DN23466_c0_g1_i1.p1 TRINITY_DN23466_c0_g1~~TRINITY_DN23466_c0_g1_i1.p1  ORF type:complete len:151 (-),score=26.71 TRINITY_DN23466_c0_g1_i1:166-618(-)
MCIRDSINAEYMGKSSMLGKLGLVLLLDQVPRNLFRGTKQMYSTDSTILSFVLNLIETGEDSEFCPLHRAILYFPLIHSENLEHQKLSIEKYKKLLELKDGINNMTLESFFKIAENHFYPISTFGRFPERNKVLERKNTDKEIAYLKAIY